MVGGLDSQTALLALPIAGLMSNRPAEEVAAAYEQLTERARQLGSPLRAPFMTLSFMALLVIPALTARLLAHSPKQMVLWAFALAQVGLAVGLWGSVWLNVSTGPAIVLGMALCFLLVFIWKKLRQ